MNVRRVAAVAAAVGIAGSIADTASADVFNGRIAFSSFRNNPPADRIGDIFTVGHDGTDLRQLTSNPADDAQSDWSPDGLEIAYRIRRPGSRINYEVARMPASGPDGQRLTFTPEGQASSQPSWFPDRSAIMFRRSGPGLVSSFWRMGVGGEDPALLHDPPGAQLYPSFSPDLGRILFTTVVSPVGDTDRAIQVMNADGTGLTTLFDAPGKQDTGPAWSPDGTRIAFESTADRGENPEGDRELWVMDADGSDPVQITRNAVHDEGAAWSPDGTMFAYSSGVDEDHTDVNVMTTDGVWLRNLTQHESLDQSPDWQAIPAPDTKRRCGDLGDADPGVRDVRANGMGCGAARRLADRWARKGRPDAIPQVRRRGRRLRRDAARRAQPARPAP